jgi:beta-glucosidase
MPHTKLSTIEDLSELLGEMTLKEKLGQLGQSPMLNYEDQKDSYLKDVKAGRWGSRILADTAWAGNAPGEKICPIQLNEIQKVAVEDSRLGIPLLFARDVIYGQATVLPVPLAQSCSWNPQLVEDAYTCIAREAASLGIHWTFAPMMDVCRDPRWGRIIECSGEDPHLNGVFAKAVIRGFQGEDPAHSERLLACAKHFCGYGFSQGGRDYDQADISESTLHNVVLPPFKAAVEAGVATVMSGFNDLGGTPVSGHRELIQTWLKDDHQFDGFVVSDWGSIADLAHFGVVQDPMGAAELSFSAGVDMAMTHEAYEGHIEQLLNEGKVSMERLDDAVMRILKAKWKAGLFHRPYVDKNQHKVVLGHREHQNKALELAEQSMVLLKNEQQCLPLKKSGFKLAIIGPHAHSKREHLGSWCLDGKSKDVTGIYEGILECAPNLELISPQTAFSDEMLEVAHQSDAIVLCIGESHLRSGEARNISELTLPAGQEELIASIGKTGKPLVVVQCGGRPLPSAACQQYAHAWLLAWQGGTQTGHAVARLLFGDANPSGKLTMTMPRCTGQIPMYYSRKVMGKTRDFQGYRPYKDVDDCPLFAFGHGLSYTSFSLSELRINTHQISMKEKATVSLTVKNTGEQEGAEIVQCYLRDMVSSATRPVRELIDFKRVHLQPQESQEVSFQIGKEQLSFYSFNKKWKAEPGSFELFIGTDSNAKNHLTLELKAE